MSPLRGLVIGGLLVVFPAFHFLIAVPFKDKARHELSAHGELVSHDLASLHDLQGESQNCSDVIAAQNAAIDGVQTYNGTIVAAGFVRSALYTGCIDRESAIEKLQDLRTRYVLQIAEAKHKAPNYDLWMRIIPGGVTFGDEHPEDLRDAIFGLTAAMPQSQRDSAQED